MASGVTLPTFEDEEILLYEKLNAAMDAIDAKFTAGIGTADLAWPLTAQGNLDMSVYNITGGRQIWGFVNAANYDTLTAALTAAGSGGVVLVPPETTITTAGGETFAGNGAAVIGAGPSSVIKFTNAPSAGYMLRCASGTGLMFADLTFDGNVTSPGTGQVGLDLQGVADVTISRCNFKDFSGAMIKISTGVDGVKIADCAFDGGSAEHVYATEAGQLTISNCTSDTAGGIAVRLEAAGASSTIQAILSNVVITDAVNYGIRLRGAAAGPTTSPISFHATNVVLDGASATHAIEVGTSSTVIESFTWIGGRINGPVQAGMLVNANGGAITGVEVNDPGAACIDLDTSRYVTVADCVLRDGTIGIDGSGCLAECKGSDNIIEGCASNIVRGAFFSSNGNSDVLDAGSEQTMFNITPESITGATLTMTMVIPAYTLETGSVLRCTAAVVKAGGAGIDSTVALNINGVACGVASLGATIGVTENFITWDVVFDSTTTLNSYFGMSSNGSGDAGNALAVAGLDTTVDQNIELNAHSQSASSLTIRSFVVHISRGREYS